jgi:hypothetical protein
MIDTAEGKPPIGRTNYASLDFSSIFTTPLIEGVPGVE